VLAESFGKMEFWNCVERYCEEERVLGRCGSILLGD
jgi:hypothetical protein